MAELEIKTFVLANAVQNSKQQKLRNYKKTFTFFDLKEYDQDKGLILEHQFEKIPSKEELCNVLREQNSKVIKKLEEAENRNGFLGEVWHNTKNMTGLGDSSKKVKKNLENELVFLEKDIKTAFFEITGENYSIENIQKFLNGEIKTKSEQALEAYIQGQILVFIS